MKEELFCHLLAESHDPTRPDAPPARSHRTPYIHLSLKGGMVTKSFIGRKTDENLGRWVNDRICDSGMELE